jgi:hypothetical protein
MSAEECSVYILRGESPERVVPFTYVEPRFDKDQHESLSPVWRSLWFPKRDRYKEWVKRVSLLGHYIPDAEPRVIPAGSFKHESVASRMSTIPSY